VSTHPNPDYKAAVALATQGKKSSKKGKKTAKILGETCSNELDKGDKKSQSSNEWRGASHKKAGKRGIRVLFEGGAKNGRTP